MAGETMNVRLEYGKEGLEVQLPADRVAAVLRIASQPAIPDLPGAVREAVQNPIGALPLKQLAKGRASACLVICDITRPVPNAEILPVAIHELLEAGIPSSGITILIATGTHRPNLGDELTHLVGSEIAGSIRCLNHYCREDEDLVDLGISPNGVPIRLNRHWVNAEFRMTLGMIEPHFMAGFAGGRKMIMPGVAGLQSIQAWHSPRFLEHPRASNGMVDGNPVHEESLAIARMAPADFIIDVALNEDKRPWAVFAGGMEEAWSAGVERVRQTTLARSPRMVDIVVTSSGGWPLDLTYYQTVKGLVGAIPILKPGGWIVIASACDEGIGNAHFRDCLFGLTTLDGLAERMEAPGWTPVADQWQVEELAKAARFGRIALVTRGIPVDYQRRVFADPYPTVEAAVEAALNAMGPDAEIAVIPKGPYVIVEPG